LNIAAARSAARGFAECQKATAFVRDAMDQFVAACRVGNWPEAERLRDLIIAGTENYLDQFMSAHHAMQEIPR